MKTWSDLQKTHRDRCDEIRAEAHVCTEAFEAFASALRTHLVENAGCPNERVRLKFAESSSSEHERCLFIDVDVIPGKSFCEVLELVLRDGHMMCRFNLRRGDPTPASAASAGDVAALLMNEIDKRLRALPARTYDGLPTKLHA